jgi:hypothetical protein
MMSGLSNIGIEPGPSYVTANTIAISSRSSSLSLVASGMVAALMWCSLVMTAPTAQARGIAVGEREPPSVAYSKISAARAITDAKIVALGAPPELTKDALEFSLQAFNANLVLPTPRLTRDPEILFYWRKAKIYLDVGVNGDGTYSFFCRDADGQESLSADDVKIADGIDPSLARVIESIG